MLKAGVSRGMVQKFLYFTGAMTGTIGFQHLVGFGLRGLGFSVLGGRGCLLWSFCFWFFVIILGA